MPKYFVTAYTTTAYTIEVEAENEDEAEQLAKPMFDNGEGIESDAEWQPEFDVWEAD